MPPDRSEERGNSECPTHLDVAGAVNVRQCRVRLIKCVEIGADGRDHCSARVASEKALENPREGRVSIRHVDFGPLLVRVLPIAQPLDHSTECRKRGVDPRAFSEPLSRGPGVFHSLTPGEVHECNLARQRLFDCPTRLEGARERKDGVGATRKRIHFGSCNVPILSPLFKDLDNLCIVLGCQHCNSLHVWPQYFVFSNLDS